MIGPRCDYKDCSHHAEQIERISLNRNHYCTPDCRDDEIKRRRAAATALRKQLLAMHRTGEIA